MYVWQGIYYMIEYLVPHQPSRKWTVGICQYNQMFRPQSRGPQSSVVMIYVQGKHFYMCFNVEMVGVENKQN